MDAFLTLPTILVARGCLAPYFLEWWKATPAPLHILDFSRWRWFEFGKQADPRWIGSAPGKDCPVVLFDRNTTTGQTLRLLKHWLQERGWQVAVLGHMDRKMGRFGLSYLDFVWDDGVGYDQLGLACQNQGGVRVVPVSEYNEEPGGAYTFCVIGGRRPELANIALDGSKPVNLRMPPVNSGNSVIFQDVPTWEEAMILGYVNQKPLITIAGAPGVTADYSYDGDIGEVVRYLEKESVR